MPDVWTAGIVSGLRPLKTKKGDRMAVFMLDDVAGNVEVVVFPETFGKHGALIEADAMVLVRGKFEKDDESARIVATELLPIATLQERTTKEVAIHLSVPPHGRPTFEALAELLSRHRGDRRVFLELDVTGKEKPLRVRSEVARAREALRAAGARGGTAVRIGIGGAAMNVARPPNVERRAFAVDIRSTPAASASSDA